MIAVDPSPIRTLAESQLTAKVGADHRLVDGSVSVQVGEGSVDESGTVTFDATARGARVALIDPNAVRALVKGKTAADAEAALAQLGDVQVSLWPSWATTVTSVDARLSVIVNDTAPTEPTAAPSAATPRPSIAAPSRRPSPSPSAAVGSAAGSAAP